jgi:hypothetical protein
MGQLDDAIREHLDLKRRRGADPTEIERAERDALGPVRRGPEGSEEAAVDHAALPDDDLAYEEEAAYDHGFDEPHDLEEPPQFGGLASAEPPVAAEPPVSPPPELEYTLDQETEVWDEFEPDAPGLVDSSRRAHAPQPADSLPAEDEPPRFADPLEGEPLEEGPLEQEPIAEEPIAKAPPPPHAAPAPPEEPPLPDPHATQRYTAEPPAAPPPRAEPPPAEPPEDVLGSDTAEFDMELEEIEGDDVLEETPEFLQDTPDHDRLWFEQRPPKDFDFDD